MEEFVAKRVGSNTVNRYRNVSCTEMGGVLLISAVRPAGRCQQFARYWCLPTALYAQTKYQKEDYMQPSPFYALTTPPHQIYGSSGSMLL